MTQHHKSTTTILALVFFLVLSSCSTAQSMNTQMTPLLLPTNTPILPSVTPSPALIPTATPTIRTDVVITPDAILNRSLLPSTNIPHKTELCKQVPTPQIATDIDNLTHTQGRFSLCVLREGISAIDLDKGVLVNSSDNTADIQLGATQSTLDGVITYFVQAINTAHIDEINTESLTYTYCENTLASLNRPGIFIVENGAIACVLTNKGQIALIRPESIDTFGGESVEFSFAVLRK